VTDRVPSRWMRRTGRPLGSEEDSMRAIGSAYRPLQ
jgi:hypothetical protein